MDQLNQEIENYLNNLVSDCLSAPVFAKTLPEQKQELQQQLANHLYNVTFETLVNNLTDEQSMELDSLDFNDPKALERIQLMAASIPGFIMTVEETLRVEAEKIKQTGQVPQ